MKTLLLNIGLDQKATTLLAATVVREILVANGFLVGGACVRDSDTEPTLVAEVSWRGDGKGFSTAIWNTCVDLEQEAIAVWSPDIEKGSLFGPKAADWGRFDTTKFVTPSGERLDAALARKRSPIVLLKG